MEFNVGKKGLIERLNRQKNLFIDTRKQMNVSPAVGLAVLPNLHGGFTSAAITTTSNSDGVISYTAPGFLGRPIPVNLDHSQHDQIIVPSNYSLPHPYFVSIYQRAGAEGDTFEERILSCPDSVLIGLFAHELGHWIKDVNQIPRNISQEISAAVKDASDPNYLNFFDEEEIDLLAAKLGFRPEILDKMEYMITCLSSYPLPQRNNGMQYTSEDLIEEIQDRRDFVLKYS